MTLRLGLIGAGSRGADVYGRLLLSHREQAAIVAITDPRADRLQETGDRHGVPARERFEHGDEFWTRAAQLELDAVIIASPDATHHDQVVQAAGLQLPMLLEKPIATTLDALEDLQRRLGGYQPPVVVAHVLRYTPFFQTLHRLLHTGRIGRLVHINHTENIGYWHFAHSFVRGNWRQEAASSPMVLAKACHDLDILRWLADAPPRHLSAYGALHHFKASQAPEGSAARCLDGCSAEPRCPYSARKIYLERFGNGPDAASWPNNVLTLTPTLEAVEEALRHGPYGRCVYHCDNDVLDTYSINILFANSVTACFTLTAFTEETTRTLHVVGTHGEIHAHMDRGEVVLTDFRTGSREPFPLSVAPAGHAGGDQALTRSFLRLVAEYQQGTQDVSPTSFQASVDAHMMAFEAHQAALDHQWSPPWSPGCRAALLETGL